MLRTIIRTLAGKETRVHKSCVLGSIGGSIIVFDHSSTYIQSRPVTFLKLHFWKDEIRFRPRGHGCYGSCSADEDESRYFSPPNLDYMRILTFRVGTNTMQADTTNLPMALEHGTYNQSKSPKHLQLTLRTDKREPIKAPIKYDTYGPYGSYRPYTKAVAIAAAKMESDKAEHVETGKDVVERDAMHSANMAHTTEQVSSTEATKTQMTERSMDRPDVSEVSGAKTSGKPLPYNWYGKYDPYANYGSYKGSVGKQGAEMEVAKVEGVGMMDA